MMKILSTLLLICTVVFTASAQQAAPSLNSDFTKPDELQSWKWLHTTEG